MAPRRRDNQLDLLDWQRPDLVQRYDDDRVRTATLRSRIARIVSATLNDSALDRAAIAEQMGAWLNEDVSLNMLNAYASEGRKDHTIPFLRLLALIHVTSDMRPLQAAAEIFGHSVIEDRWLGWVEVGQLADQKHEIDRSFDAARRQARRGIRR